MKVKGANKAVLRLNRTTFLLPILIALFCKFRIFDFCHFDNFTSNIYIPLLRKYNKIRGRGRI